MKCKYKERRKSRRGLITTEDNVLVGETYRLQKYSGRQVYRRTVYQVEQLIGDEWRKFTSLSWYDKDHCKGYEVEIIL